MNFASDNWAGATPEVSAALARCGGGFAPSYGGDAASLAVTQAFREVFEHPGLEVWFTATGTASNTLALAGAARVGGLVFCSEDAHIHTDEWGAAEQMTGGMKLVPLPHDCGLLAPEVFGAALAHHTAHGRRARPVALSLTQASECGTAYPVERLRALTAIARTQDLVVQMDGARFANAVAASGATPAELTWRAGVDILSFGGTKNGCWAAEAMVVFAPEKFRDLGPLRQRAGQTFSKSRFVAAQFEAYLADGNWLRWAAHANAMAAKLQAGITASGRARVSWPTDINQVFAVLRAEAVERVRAAGGSLHEWSVPWLKAEQQPGPDEVPVRLVTSWATTKAEVERFIELL